MQVPIAFGQLQALRSLAAVDGYRLVDVLCDRVERLQEIELAALNFVTATNKQDEALAALDLCRRLGVDLGLATEAVRTAA